MAVSPLCGEHGHNVTLSGFQALFSLTPVTPAIYDVWLVRSSHRALGAALGATRDERETVAHDEINRQFDRV